MPDNNDQNPTLTRTQRTAVQAGSGTGLAVVLEWIFNTKLDLDMPTAVILIIGGALTVAAAKIMLIGEARGWWPDTKPTT